MKFRNLLLPLVCLAFSAAGQNDLFGNLAFGSYRPGFTTIYSYDYTRAPLVEQRELTDDQQRGRAVQINIWYPASQHTRPTSLRHYLDLLSREVDFRRKLPNEQDLVNAIAIEQANSHGIEIDKRVFGQLLKTEFPMRAQLDAKPAKGKFPLIVIGPETAFKWSVLAEYLASHGFVVACVPIAGAREKLPDYERTLFVQKNFVEAAEAGINDLQHAMSIISKLNYVDQTQVGILGYSAGVTTGLGLLTKGFKAQAVVSLEGAIGGAYGPKVLSETTSYSPYLITVPILHFFVPSYGFDFHWLNNEYKYSDRTIIAVYPMRHEDFTSYGMIERFAPGITGKDPGEPQLAFETAAVYTLHYFKAHVLKDTESEKFVNQTLDENVRSGQLQKNVPDEWKGVNRLPGLKTLDEYHLKALLERDGFQAVYNIYKELSLHDPRPFSTTAFFNFGRTLKKTEEKEQWYEAYVSSYPDSPESHYLLAQAKEKLSKNAEAISHYEKTLEIFNTTDAILLEPIFTNIIKRRIDRLKAL